MSLGERTIKDEGLAFAITSKSIDHTKGTLTLQHLLQVVQKANVLVLESYMSEISWLRAIVLQVGNHEAFVGIFQDLKWCTHILNVTLRFGMSTSHDFYL
jgi:hypothetical protein